MNEAASDMVSVVVPTYNGGRHLKATLTSLAAQTYPNVEIIVVDDGSTDDSCEVALASGAAYNVITQPNLGVAIARNRGLAHARGRWVGFIDQDDLWRSDRVQNLVDFARSHEVNAVASTETPFALTSDRVALRAVGDGREHWPQLWIDEGDESTLTAPPPPTALSPGPPEPITVERLMEGAAMLTTAVLYDRETAIAAGGFAPHARALDDHLLNLNVARIAGPIQRIDTKDLLYRVHPASTSTVSPMSAPLLSAMASVRLGGIFPSKHRIGPNIEHLLYGLSESTLATPDQAALLQLTVPPGSRARWWMRWTKRRLGRVVRGRRA
jgi:glycosyltransferase involved in cell wall biosynthesis